MTSAITMNKGYAKLVVRDIDRLRVAKSVTVFRWEMRSVTSLKELRFPLFVKPNQGGSSVGMSKIENKEELGPALEKAFAQDDQVIVEEFVKGREFSVGIVRLGGAIHVLPVTEIISSNEFFDYQAKYTPGLACEITPADLSSKQKEKIKEIVAKIYLRLNCRGMVRVDFILQEDSDDFYFIEINTTPGQSGNSLIPQQVKAFGVSMQTFYTALIEETSTGHCRADFRPGEFETEVTNRNNLF